MDLATNKACFPLGEFVRANRQKSRNASYLFAANFSPTNFNQSRCRILVFASRRANKVTKQKIGFRLVLQAKQQVNNAIQTIVNEMPKTQHQTEI